MPDANVQVVELARAEHNLRRMLESVRSSVTATAPYLKSLSEARDSTAKAVAQTVADAERQVAAFTHSAAQQIDALRAAEAATETRLANLRQHVEEVIEPIKDDLRAAAKQARSAAHAMVDDEIEDRLATRLREFEQAVTQREKEARIALDDHAAIARSELRDLLSHTAHTAHNILESARQSAGALAQKLDAKLDDVNDLADRTVAAIEDRLNEVLLAAEARAEAIERPLDDRLQVALDRQRDALLASLHETERTLSRRAEQLIAYAHDSVAPAISAIEQAHHDFHRELESKVVAVNETLLSVESAAHRTRVQLSREVPVPTFAAHPAAA